MRAVLWTAVAAGCPFGSTGCVFHCGTSLCGSTPVVVNRSFYGGAILGDTPPVPALDLSLRGITAIAAGAFECYDFATDFNPQPDAINAVLLDSNPLGTLPNGSVFREAPFVSLRNCSISALPPAAFTEYLYTTASSASVSAATSSVYIDLSDNVITTLPRRLFAELAGSMYITLANNRITGAVTQELFASCEGSLNLLELGGNAITAVPTTFVPPVYGFFMNDGASLRCDSFERSDANGLATATNCTCEGGGVLNELCGYLRCTPTLSGCPGNWISNTTNCSIAPSSACVDPATAFSEGQYFNPEQGAFVRFVDCATLFRIPGGGFRAAYEFEPATTSSNRECSICSRCPAGYTTTPCTRFANTICTKDDELTAGAVATIVFFFAALTAALVLSLLFIRYRTVLKSTRHVLGQTQSDLELTEQLLGDEREENERMSFAWTIPEEDLHFETVIGVGAFGKVFRGSWGHIPVAIKVLHSRIDDLDPIITEDFDREVSFMRSVRHPNLLIFYGAGTNCNRQAYLVTELMALGSLRKLLADTQRVLSWDDRLQFVLDVASGMQYLHSCGSIHRDLKAENCFVDSDMRVKVADFGTGRILSKMKEEGLAAASSTDETSFDGADPARDRGRSLSRGVGSLLWMAPEALGAERILAELAPALDVYAFAIVLWEVWTRASPWGDIQSSGIKFVTELRERVVAGERPTPPPTTANPPDGFAALMQECWDAAPKKRPNFRAIIARVGRIRRTVHST